MLAAMAIQSTCLPVLADEWRSRSNRGSESTPQRFDELLTEGQSFTAAAGESETTATRRAVPLNARVIKRDGRTFDSELNSTDSGIRQTAGPDGKLRTASTSSTVISQGQVANDSTTVTSESLAAAAKQRITHSPAELPSASYTWGDSYQSRMGSVLPQQASTQGDGPEVVEWWHRNSVQHQQNNRHTVIAVTRPDKVRAFVADHTLPPQGEPDQAVYDSRSRFVELGPVRPVSAEEQIDNASQIARLTRDITKIQPTLEYALDGIRVDQLPDDFFEKMDNGSYVVRASAPTVLQWAPTNLAHNPLYFEDPALERYGHTYHPLIQPFASSGRFATQLVGLPYQMTLHPVHSMEYTLGWYRPGDFAPKKHYQIPFNEEATLMQIATIAGLLLIFP